MKTITRVCVALVVTPILVIASQNVFAQALHYFPGYLSIPAASLLPRDNTIAYDTNGVRMFTTDGGTVVFQAPVNIPNWSVITNVTLEAVDNSADGFAKATLREYKFNTFLSLATAQTDAATAPGDVRVVAPIGTSGYHQVDNQQFSYGIEVQLFNGAGGPGSVGVYKIIIDYLRLEVY